MAISAFNLASSASSSSSSTAAGLFLFTAVGLAMLVSPLRAKDVELDMTYDRKFLQQAVGPVLE